MTETSTSSNAGVVLWRFVKEIVIILVVALGLSFLVRTFIVQAFYVPSQSMENTLMPNDRILASKITTRFAGVDRGQIVVFHDPGDWLDASQKRSADGLPGVLEWIGLLPSNTGDDLVKRVIAVGGDHVRCCSTDGRIVLNGVPLTEPYVKPGDTSDDVRFDVTVPQGRIFVMGDNRNASADSRYHLNDKQGTVPLDNVVGRVVLTVWPFSAFSTHPVPAVPFDDPRLDDQTK
ncbi:MAG: signal peptidase I [Candidatus Nanopelagicales bacterium]